MTNALTTFTFAPANAQVRVVLHGVNPWFIAADACRCLGFDDIARTGTHKYLGHLNDSEKWTLTRKDTPDLFGGIDRRVQSLTVISESGLYKLVMRSDKPEARFFS